MVQDCEITLWNNFVKLKLQMQWKGIQGVDIGELTRKMKLHSSYLEKIIKTADVYSWFCD